MRTVLTAADLSANTRKNSPVYIAIGASNARRIGLQAPMLLTADHIARLASIPVRTAQDRIARMRKRGVPVVRLPPSGRGQPPWAVPLDAYCRSRGMDPADVLEALSPSDSLSAQAA